MTEISKSIADSIIEHRQLFEVHDSLRRCQNAAEMSECLACDESCSTDSTDTELQRTHKQIINVTFSINTNCEYIVSRHAHKLDTA